MNCAITRAKKSVLIGFLLLISIPSVASATNFFSWDADSTSTTSRSCNLKNATIDTSEKRSGTGSMRIVVKGNVQESHGCQGLPIKHLGSGTDGGWLYYRWWMKIDPNFKWGTTATMKANRVMRPSGAPPPIYTMFFRKDEFRVAECNYCNYEPRAKYNFIPAQNPAVTDWQEYVVAVKKQTGNSGENGEFHFWVNGQKIASFTGVRYFNGGDTWAEAWGAIMVNPYPQLNGSASDGGIIWIDNVSLDDEWNSTFPQNVDSTPPRPPTGLSIR